MNNADYRGWLDGLPSGTRVLIGAGRGEMMTPNYQAPRVGRVIRRTATQIVVQVGTGERRFRSDTGRALGEGGFGPTLQPVPEGFDDALAAHELYVADRRRLGDIFAAGERRLSAAVIAAMLGAYDRAIEQDRNQETDA